MNKVITLNHGSGGRQSHDLIDGLFAERFGMDKPLTDSALMPGEGFILAFTTDSYVVEPLFFPGGNIGKLAVCGTVNDLAVSGAVPSYLSASFIIEEGFGFQELELIVDTMADEAKRAGVRIVTGDTKVVGRGKCDKLFIATSGTGFLKSSFAHISAAGRVRTGDNIIVSGPLGNHAIAVLGARNNLGFSSPVESDCTCLNHMIKDVLDSGADIHFMRDLTRGGLASVLHELSGMTGYGMDIIEKSVPVDEPVKGLCEVLGFDPLYLANEGKIVIIADENDSPKIINILQSHLSGKNASVIGKINGKGNGRIIIVTSGRGRRILDLPSGIQLPRIC